MCTSMSGFQCVADKTAKLCVYIYETQAHTLSNANDCTQIKKGKLFFEYGGVLQWTPEATVCHISVNRVSLIQISEF